MKVSYECAFSILDGRLSTSIDDVYKMLNFIFDTHLFIHQLPKAMEKLTEVNPKWFEDGKKEILEIKGHLNTDDFETLIFYIRTTYPFPEYYIELEKIDVIPDFFDPLQAN